VERSVDVLEMLRQKGQSGRLLLLKMVTYLPWYPRSSVVFEVELCVDCGLGFLIEGREDARETSFRSR
jgi:hypothetical protein